MSLTIRTIDMHTGGEPVRIITGGYPDILGETILDKRRSGLRGTSLRAFGRLRGHL